MTTACRYYCRQAVHLSRELIQLAQNAIAGCDHAACLVLFGIILDSGSRICLEAEKRLKEIEAQDGLKPPPGT